MPKPRQGSTSSSSASGGTGPWTGYVGAVGSEAVRSLFGPEDDNAVTGEVLVKLSPQSANEIKASIPTGPLRGLAVGLAAEFGIPEIDEVLGRYEVQSVVRLHPPLPPLIAASSEEDTLSRTFKVRLAEGANAVEVVAALNEAPAVEVAEPNRWREATAVPNDPSFAAQWGLTRINCPAAWDRTVGVPEVVVAVVDTGVDLDHPELAALLLPGQDLVDLAGASPPPGTHFEGDWTVRDADPQDEVGHGTHVAGTIACASNNATGVAGGTWSCSLLPVKVLTRVVENAPPHRVRGVGSAADIAAGIRWAVDHGARIMNLSLGGYTDTAVERDAIAYAISKGVVVVAAMGNDDTSTPSYPAAYPGVIAVGATTQTDQRAGFSNTGAHIDVSAPGVDVLSTVWNDGFATMSGTSMASPHVAAVAALILSCNSSLSADAVGDAIRQTAQPLRDNPADPIPNDRYGSGLVDASAAVSRACPIFVPPTGPTAPTVGRPTMPTLPTTLPVFPTRPTLPTIPTRPTLPTFPTRPTLTLPTRPTLPTFPTAPTRPTFPTRPTLPTFPTRPTLTLPPTRPTFPTFPTRPTLPTFPTRPTLTFPTRPTLPTFPTRPTFPTFPTRPTLTLPPTRPTLPTFPTRPTLTFPTRPTLTFPTRPTITFPTIPRPIPTPIPEGAGAGGYDPYGGGGYEYYGGQEGYGGLGGGYEGYGYDPYATGYEGYGGGGGYEGYYEPYGGTGYEGYGGYGGYGGGYEGYDPYAAGGYEGYYDPYGTGGGYESYGGYEGYDPSGGYGGGYGGYGGGYGGYGGYGGGNDPYGY